MTYIAIVVINVYKRFFLIFGNKKRVFNVFFLNVYYIYAHSI